MCVTDVYTYRHNVNIYKTISYPMAEVTQDVIDLVFVKVQNQLSDTLLYLFDHLRDKNALIEFRDKLDMMYDELFDRASNYYAVLDE